MNGFYLIYLVTGMLTLWGILSRKKEKKNLIFYTGCFFLILMSVCQDFNSGGDGPMYYGFYQEIAEMNVSQMLSFTTWEPAFVFLNKFTHILGMGPRMLYLFVAIIAMVPIFACIYRESKIPAVGLLAFVALGFFRNSMSFYRQACAVGILFLSWRFIRERKLIPFVLTVLLAALFHRTAAAFAVMYFVAMVPVNGYIVLAAAGASAACALLGAPIMGFLNMLLRVPYALEARGGLSMYIVLWALVMLLYMLKGKELNDRHLKLPFLMLLLAAAMQSMTFINGTFSRLVWYFSVSLVVLVPELYETVFLQKENTVMYFLQKRFPALHGKAEGLYDTKWFSVLGFLLMFAVLFVWFHVTLMGFRYNMAPMG